MQLSYFDIQGIQCKVESITSDVPEVSMLALHGAQPRVLKLLVPPESGKTICVIPQDIAATPRCRDKIEECSIRIENAGFYAAQSRFAHRLTFSHA